MITRSLFFLPRATTALTGGRRRLASTQQPSRQRPRPSPTDPARQKIRRVVLTGAVALVVIVGSITGARLKTDREVSSKQRQVAREIPLDERIAMLETRRAELVTMKMPLERKLAGLRERMEAEKKKAAAVEGRA